MKERYKILLGNCVETIKTIESNSIQCCITSPPYYNLRDYGHPDQIGLEKTPEEYIDNLVKVFNEIYRVLKDDGVLWINLSDTYKDKNLIGIPWKTAFKLQSNGWYLRQDIIWNKPSSMPESITDRCTRSHEYIFLLSKSKKYYYDNESIKEPSKTYDNYNRDRDQTRLNNTPGRTKMKGLVRNNYEMKNKRSVWTIATKPYTKSHFATYPIELIEPCVLAGTKKGDIIIDPFAGSGTTGEAALKYFRKSILCEINESYIPLIEERINKYNLDEMFI